MSSYGDGCVSPLKPQAFSSEAQTIRRAANNRLALLSDDSRTHGLNIDTEQPPNSVVYYRNQLIKALHVISVGLRGLKTPDAEYSVHQFLLQHLFSDDEGGAIICHSHEISQ